MAGVCIYDGKSHRELTAWWCSVLLAYSWHSVSATRVSPENAAAVKIRLCRGRAACGLLEHYVPRKGRMSEHWPVRPQCLFQTLVQRQ